MCKQNWINEFHFNRDHTLYPRIHRVHREYCDKLVKQVKMINQWINL